MSSASSPSLPYPSVDIAAAATLNASVSVGSVGSVSNTPATHAGDERKLSTFSTSSESGSTISGLAATSSSSASSAIKKPQLFSKTSSFGIQEQARSELQIRMNVVKLTVEDMVHLIDREEVELRTLSLQYEEMYDPPIDLQRKLEEKQARVKDLKACKVEKIHENELFILRYAELESPCLFAHPDSQMSLQFEEGDGRKAPGVKAGTLPKLIERLTFDEYTDPNFTKEFFLTYRSFISPEEFLSLLIQRFNMPLPKDKSKVDEFREKILIPVRLRVLLVVKKWIDEHYDDFLFDSSLLNRTKAFLKEIVASQPPSAPDVGISPFQGEVITTKAILNLISYRETNVYSRFDDDTVLRYTSPPEPILPLNGVLENEVLRWDAEEIARQLTLIDFELFRNISQTDLSNLGCGSAKEACVTISAFIDRFNRLSKWVVSSIVGRKGLHARKEALIKFIDMAACFRHIHNFNGLMSVVAALQSSSVFRLKHTWSMVPSSHKKVFESLCEFTSNSGNYKQYRRYLASIKPPCIPYIGVYLTDLTFIRDGNPNEVVVEEKRLINFSKRRMISSVLSEMLQYQETPFVFTKIVQLNQLLFKLDGDDDDTSYQESLSIEPRGSDMHHNRRVAFIVNPKARNGRAKKIWLKKLKPKVEELFHGRWGEFLTTGPKEASAMAKEAMQAGFNVLVTVGGDGTFNEVVNAYVRYGGLARNVVLAIIPMGTGDDMVKTLHLSLDPLEALEVINQGFTAELDAGAVHCTGTDGKEYQTVSYFANICSLGISSVVAEDVNKSSKAFGGKATYFMSSIKVGLRHKNRPVRVKIDNSSWFPCNLYELAICNGKWYGGGFEIAPSASPSDGLFDIVLLEDVGLMESAKLSHLIRQGQHINNKNRHLFFGSEVFVEEVTSSKDHEHMMIESDGELIGTLPAKFQLLKEAIAVVIPESYNVGRIDGVIARRASTIDSPMIFRKQSMLSLTGATPELSTPGSISDLYSSQAMSEYDPTQTARRSFDGSVSKAVSRSLSTSGNSIALKEGSGSATALKDMPVDGETAQKLKLRESLEGKKGTGKSLARSNSDSHVGAYAVKRKESTALPDQAKTSTNSLDESSMGPGPKAAEAVMRKNSIDGKRALSIRAKKAKCFGVDLGELLVREKALVPRFMEACGEYLTSVSMSSPADEIKTAVLQELNKDDGFYKSVLNFKYMYEKSKDDQFMAHDETPIEIVLGAMALFLSHLPKPLCDSLFLELQGSGEPFEDYVSSKDGWKDSKCREVVVEALKKMPKINFMVLAYLCCLLNTAIVAIVPESSRKVAEVFAPPAFGSVHPVGEAVDDIEIKLQSAVGLMQTLILHSTDLFSGWQSK